MAKLERLLGGLAVNRQKVVRHGRWGGGTQWEVGISLLQLDATLGGRRSLALSLALGRSQQSTQAAGVLAQLHSVDGEAARLRGDVQHGGGTWPLG